MPAVKHVVLVDPYISAVKLAERFRQAGAAVIKVQSTEEVPPLYRSTAGSDGFVETVIHRGDLAETVRRIAGYEPVAVVAGCESGVELADALSTVFDLPTNGVELSGARRDKYVMIETIKKAGVAAASQILVTDENQLTEWHRLLGGRVVLKPVRSAGGDHVHFCDSPAESVAAFHKISGALNIFAERNAGVVAQEYLCGTEYVVNTVSRDGRHRICDIWRTSRIDANGVTDLADAGYLMPRRGEVQDVLAGYVVDVLDALGIRHGPAHAEIKLTNAGPRLVEVGARIAGGDIPSYAKLAVGEAQLEWTVHAYLDPEHFHAKGGQDYRRARSVANVALICPVDGILRRYRDLDTIRSLESVHELHVRVRPGDRITRTIDDLTYPVALVLAHNEEAVVLRDANTIRYLDGHGFYELDGEEPR